MPVQTAIQHRRGTASSWTSTNPTLAAGEIGFESDTGKFKIGTGSTAWNSLAYATASPLTTKGDLYTYGTADTRLAVGNNGETLVADSSASTGLRWQGDWNTGKNKIINGDFYINQRNFTSTTSTGIFTFDRWLTSVGGGTSTISAQTFTPGTAPVAGYEGKNYIRVVSSGQSGANDYTAIQTKIEDSRTLAGQTATISFWAKASTGTPSVAVEFYRDYGTGGSPSVPEFLVSAKTTISSSWARYSMTVSLSSLSGKTLGTTQQGFLGVVLYTSAGTNFNANTQSLGIQSATIEFWGVQLEAGSVATPFTTATGTLAGELAACQRYYWRNTGGNGAYGGYANGSYASATLAEVLVHFPTPMRISPTVVEFATLGITDTAAVQAVTGLTIGYSTPLAAMLSPACAAGGVQYRACKLVNNNNSTTAYLGFSAEL